jgi:hypothetical protein
MNELSNFSKEEANFISEDSYYDDRDEISKIVFSSFLIYFIISNDSAVLKKKN